MKQLQLQDVIPILEAMYAHVDAPFDWEAIKNDPEWFLKYSWSEKQQKEFSDWIVQYLRNEYNFPKKLAMNTASWFIFMYGFTTKQTEDSNGHI